MSKNKFMFLLTTLVISGTAFAETAVGSPFSGESAKAYAALGAGLCMGMSVLAGALGQGRAVAMAVEGIARNPGAKGLIQPVMILGLALIESLVLFGFVIAYFLQGKV